VLHDTPLPAKQTLTPARSIMGHLSSLEQSCQGATFYKQPKKLKRDLSSEESGKEKLRRQQNTPCIN